MLEIENAVQGQDPLRWRGHARGGEDQGRREADAHGQPGRRRGSGEHEARGRGGRERVAAPPSAAQLPSCQTLINAEGWVIRIIGACMSPWKKPTRV